VAEREHDRIPHSVEVKFRTTSSFLFAYSTNLSKGGMFLETAADVPIGSAIALRFRVADEEACEVRGRVSWRRDAPDADGAPAGIGVEFDAIDDTLGEVIDRLVTRFQGLTVLLFCPDTQDRHSVARMVRSIVGTADVVEAGGTSTAEALLGPEIDLVVVDGDAPDGAGLLVLRAAKSRDRKIPAIVLSADAGRQQQARELGADEIADHPPDFHDFQELLLRALGRPSTIG
jgi:uncharacterized protein (TIGR02266 family)